jgi:hypothetical protein
MVTALLAVAAPLSAQQPAPAAKMAPPAAAMKMDMKMMDSMNARLDSAVARMNRTTGDARVNAMADVLNALVAEHRMMHAHMEGMMGEHMGGMPGMKHPMPGMAHPDSAARPRK